VPLPVGRDDRATAMLKFVGVLMGMSLRFQHYLDFKVAPAVWKLVVDEEPTVGDIKDMDPVVGN